MEPVYNFLKVFNAVKLGFSLKIVFVITVRTNNLFLALLVKIKVLVAYAVSKNYVVVILLIILSYTALFLFHRSSSFIEAMI